MRNSDLQGFNSPFTGVAARAPPNRQDQPDKLIKYRTKPIAYDQTR